MATFDLCVMSGDDLASIRVPKQLKSVSEHRYPNQPVVIGLDICLHNKRLIIPVINVKFVEEEGVIYVPENMVFLWKNSGGIVNVHLLDAGNYPSVAKMVVTPLRRTDGLPTTIDDIKKVLTFPTYVTPETKINEPGCSFKIVHLEASDRHSIEAGFAYPEYTEVEIYDSHTCEKICVFKPTRTGIHTLNDVHMEEAHPIDSKIDSIFKKATAIMADHDVEMPEAPCCVPQAIETAPQPELDFSRVKTREYSKLFMYKGEVVYVKRT